MTAGGSNAREGAVVGAGGQTGEILSGNEAEDGQGGEGEELHGVYRAGTDLRNLKRCAGSSEDRYLVGLERISDSFQSREKLQNSYLYIHRLLYRDCSLLSRATQVAADCNLPGLGYVHMNRRSDWERHPVRATTTCSGDESLGVVQSLNKPGYHVDSASGQTPGSSKRTRGRGKRRWARVWASCRTAKEASTPALSPGWRIAL